MIKPFTRVYFDNKQGVTVKQTIPNDDIRVVQKVCIEKDDGIRWLLEMVADTEMRLAEAAGLVFESFDFSSHSLIRDSQVVQCEIDFYALVLNPNLVRIL